MIIHRILFSRLFVSEDLFKSTLTYQFIAREGEAPAEPMRRQLGRSLALPYFARLAERNGNDKKTAISVHFSRGELYDIGSLRVPIASSLP